MRLVVPLCLLLVGCDDHILGAQPRIFAACEHDPPLTYENFGEGFMEVNCTGCHSSLLKESQRSGAPLGADFETWELVLEWVAEIEDRAVVLQTMPPGGQTLPQPDRERLEEWLVCEVWPAAQGGGG